MKHFTLKLFLLIACLCGATSVWAEDTFTTVYTRALSDWTDADKTDWNASGAVEVNATNGLGANANLTATYLNKSFKNGEQSS